MDQKPKIEYISRYFVPGSEAQVVAPEIRKPKTTLPKPKREKVQSVYINPVALCAITVAVVMLIVMAVSAAGLRDSWKEYNSMFSVLSEVKRENAKLEHYYHAGYDLEDVKNLAGNLDMIPAEEAQTMIVRLPAPKTPVQRTAWDDFKWFVNGLFDE